MVRVKRTHAKTSSVVFHLKLVVLLLYVCAALGLKRVSSADVQLVLRLPHYHTDEVGALALFLEHSEIILI